MELKTKMGGANSATKGLQKTDDVGVLSNIQSRSQLSAVSVTSDSSAINYVYQRKRLLKNPSPVFSAPAPAPQNITLVFERRKNQKSAVINRTVMVSANSYANGACSSAIRSDNLLVPLCQKTTVLCEREGTKVSSIEQPLTTSETVDGCVTEDRGSDVKDKMNKTIELYSVDDSCSSSMHDMDMDYSMLKSKVDDTDECSSSGALVVDVMGNAQSLLVKSLCVSILRSHGLLSDFRVNRFDTSEEDGPSCSGSSCSRSCNVCGVMATATEMLICDECEEAFHVSCFNPSIRHPPIDDWYCQPCSRKKHNLLKERAVRKSSIIGTGKCSVTSEGDFSPISLMLQDCEPYITSVRVGKGFQAIVPEWSGPVAGGVSSYPEPMHLEASLSFNFKDPFSVKPRKAYIGNWLQCRDVVVGIGDDIDGTICGKWRRAPLFEVQTDNWDCFHSIFWDLTHADCAAPQELETEEVLRQLKYIELLRPRLAAKRRKLEACKVNGSEDTSQCTGSIVVGRNS